MNLNPISWIGESWIGDAVGAIGTYFTEGQKIKAAVTERKDEITKLSLESKIKTATASINSDMKMDEGARANAGWMDDISFYVFLAPAVLAFIPSMVVHIEAGFAVLSTMPIWYQYALGMMLVSVWGYRKLVSPIIQSIAKAYLGK